MKVKELIELLKTFDKEAMVLISSDEEGNSYSPLENGFAEGDFDKEKGTFADPRNYIWTMDEEEMIGKYIILYPR